MNEKLWMIIAVARNGAALVCDWSDNAGDLIEMELSTIGQDPNEWAFLEFPIDDGMYRWDGIFVVESPRYPDYVGDCWYDGVWTKLDLVEQGRY